MTTYYINGKFLSQRITGVQRFAREIVKSIDANVQFWKDAEYVLLVPDNYDKNFQLNNIKIEIVKGNANYFWEQVSLYKYLKKKENTYLISLCNISPIALKKKNIVCIHDLAIIDHPEFYSKKFVFAYKFIYKREIKNSIHLLTVSDFSKKKIMKAFGVDDKRIDVIYNAVDRKFGDIAKISGRIKNLSYERLCFSVGSMSLNKNMKYTVACAKANPYYFFLISGEKNKVFDCNQDNEELPSNVLFAGYLSDDDLKYVYSRCEFFLFPSIYEGFGIPPLEAVSFGCKKIIVSDIPTMHEIFGDKVNYINPLKYDDTIRLADVKAYDYKDVMNRFSWDESAKKIVCLINDRMV